MDNIKEPEDAHAQPRREREVRPIKIDPDAYYLTEDLAALRRVSRSTLEIERCTGGGIPFSRIGKRVFYKGSDIIEFLEGRRQTSTADKPKISGPKPRPVRKPKAANDGEAA